MILPLVCLLFLSGYAVLLGFYYRHWKRLPAYTPQLPGDATISVIVAARNEEHSLPFLLRDLREQTYAAHLFEVIVVNDFSTDGTAELAAAMPPNFRMILPETAPELSSKKKALAAGVAAAKGKLLLITDADCRVGRNWVATVAAFYRQTGASFIAAPVRYTYRPSFLQVLQVLDFLTLQGITAASVAANFHTMCNGANLAYTKKAFEEVKGFEGIDKIPTGDDMLLMHKIWKQAPEKVRYLKSKDATVSTPAVPSWRDFLHQRRRWASKTLVYEDRRILPVLGFVLLFNLLPPVLLLGSFWTPTFLWYGLLFFCVKAALEWPFVFSVARFYGEQKLLRYFFLLQPAHVFYTLFVGISSQFGTYQWKGRRAKAGLPSAAAQAGRRMAG